MDASKIDKTCVLRKKLTTCFYDFNIIQANTFVLFAFLMTTLMTILLVGSFTILSRSIGDMLLNKYKLVIVYQKGVRYQKALLKLIRATSWIKTNGNARITKVFKTQHTQHKQLKAEQYELHQNGASMFSRVSNPYKNCVLDTLFRQF